MNKTSKGDVELFNNYGARRFVISENYEVNFIDTGNLISLSYDNFKTLIGKYETQATRLQEAEKEIIDLKHAEKHRQASYEQIVEKNKQALIREGELLDKILEYQTTDIQAIIKLKKERDEALEEIERLINRIELVVDTAHEAIDEVGAANYSHVIKTEHGNINRAANSGEANRSLDR